jgi:hypothetical protein
MWVAGAFAGVLTGFLFATGVFVAPVEAQCPVISADAACRTSVPPAIRVDFGAASRGAAP